MSRPCVLLPVSICKFIMMTAMILSNISILFESNTFIRIGKNIVICAISFVSITCAVWLLGCCHFSIQHFPFRLSIFIWFWVFDFMCIFMQHTKSKIFMNIKKKIKKKIAYQCDKFFLPFMNNFGGNRVAVIIVKISLVFFSHVLCVWETNLMHNMYCLFIMNKK